MLIIIQLKSFILRDYLMKTIFVVDDKNINLQTADEALSGIYDVFTLVSASAMFDLLNNIKPDLILLDIMMPGIDGFEALKKLKADERYAQIPVIFLTSQKDEDTKIRGFEAGIIDCIIKPFFNSVLLDRVKTHLQ